MRPFLLVLLAAAPIGVMGQAASPSNPERTLSVESIFAHGSPIPKAPEQLKWSPDGKHLTFLDGGQLMDVDPATGRTHVLVGAAKMGQLAGGPLSERDRDHRDRYRMASYTWAPDSKHILFDSNGRLWLYDLKNGIGFEMGFAGIASGDDPKFSPDASTISFVRDHGLAAVRLGDAGTPTTAVAPVSSSQSERGLSITNGEVDWLYQEELAARSNYDWSPDSKNIAYLEMNESAVPNYPLVDWIPNHSLVEGQRYPQPGDANPEVRVGIVSAKSGKTVWVKLPIAEGEDYIPRFGWVDNKSLWIETLTRDQKHRRIYFADVAGTNTQQVLEISDEKYVDMNYDLAVGDGSVVLSNWQDGHNHLYLYGYDTARPLAGPLELKKQLTSGEFDVSDVYRVDAARKLVYFASNEESATGQQIWRVNFEGQRKQLSQGAGFHEASFAPDGNSYTDTYSTRMRPPLVRICSVPEATTGGCRVIWETHAVDSWHLEAPQELKIAARDGTPLYGTLLLPPISLPTSIPLIVSPYGGPDAQGVVDQWSEDLLFDELLAQHGFAVLRVDNRGMAGRGRNFAQTAYRNFGAVQLDDQLAAVDAVLAKYPQLDGKRLGWWGWSWGGTFTLYAMTHSDRIRIGVAIAPVTDWHDYDSTYTERYLGTPAENPDGYKEFSPVNAVANLKGKLLLIHGTGDDNVHLENTMQLVQKLIEAGKNYDLQIYPRKTHSLAGNATRLHMYGRILNEFEQELKAENAGNAAH